MLMGAGGLGKPWLVYLEDVFVGISMYVEKGWLGQCNDSAVANFGHDTRGYSVERMFVDFTSQFPRKGQELSWHFVQM
jgi:hypothetical protein